MTELTINLIVCALLFFIGVLIKYSKAYYLIAGYNTAAPEVKEQIDAKALGDFMGRQLMIAAVTPLLGYGLKQAGLLWGMEVGLGLFILIIIYTVIKARKFNPPAVKNKSAGKDILITLIIIIALAAGIAWAAMPPAFNLENKQFAISGAYGVSINYNDIEELDLVTEIPPLSMRTNGLGLGPILKGHFHLEDKGKALLFLRSSSGPVLIIKRQTNPEMLMINCKNAAETRLLYNSLNKKLNSVERSREEGTSVAADTDQPTRSLNEISIDDFDYPPDYPKFEIRYDKQQLSWLKGDSNFTGKPGGIIGNTMFGMNEELADFLEPNIVKPESELIFTAAAVPGLNNPEYKLRMLDKDNSSSIYSLNKNTMLAPKEGGEYIFILWVDWGNGDNSMDYWFKLKVNS
ncbi:MAG: DUF3784 domain-containing protein [Syntrophomonas sp.]|uniref:DUF3784 domain-containing protein n=1 Tax=Syntrophomonas sp. TaxID=2053627 RepID=UPI00262FA347|nr:DUF3784 domain-containing protein [Syntrophomonas sp.]MDD4627114.1 DUF3784 domain-containing protein [Syntrophomonas sp.]